MAIIADIQPMDRSYNVNGDTDWDDYDITWETITLIRCCRDIIFKDSRRLADFPKIKIRKGIISTDIAQVIIIRSDVSCGMGPLCRHFHSVHRHDP